MNSMIDSCAWNVGTGMGSITSVDGDDVIPGEPLIGQIKVSSFLLGRRAGRCGKSTAVDLCVALYAAPTLSFLWQAGSACSDPGSAA